MADAMPPATDQVQPLPQPVPLNWTPLAPASSKTVKGARWARSSSDTSRSHKHKTKHSNASKSSVASRSASEAGHSFLDTGDDDSEDEYESTTWPRPGPEALVAPPPQKRLPRKPSLWKRVLNGRWRSSFTKKSKNAWSSMKRRGRLNRRTPKDLLPKTWGEYRKAYAARRVDIDDPPAPPPKDKTSAEQTPFEAGALYAPRPVNDELRQNVVDRLDPLGKRAKQATPAPAAEPATYEPGSIKEGDVCKPTPAADFGTSLKAHPAFKRIVAFARQAFGTSFSMLSVLDNDQQVFLAESGLGGMEAIPRDIGFCAHTLLASTKGLVILDTEKDWRFPNTPLVTKYGSRFYAGVPLLCPRDAAFPSGGSMPLGTLCIVDTKPREEFGDRERRKLIGLANFATQEIQTWQQSRVDSKLAKMDDNYHSLRKTLQAAPKPTVPLVSVTAADEAGPSSTAGHAASAAAVAPSVQTTGKEVEVKSVNAMSETSSYQSAATSVSPVQKTFSAATRLVAEALELDLCYLVRVELAAAKPNTVSLVAAHGLPQNETAHFDSKLHLRALRAPEKGLLYQHPRRDQLKQDERFPQEFASALLVPVHEDAHKGFVLAAYTLEPSRVFGSEDLAYLNDIAAELKIFVAQA